MQYRKKEVKSQYIVDALRSEYDRCGRTYFSTREIAELTGYAVSQKLAVFLVGMEQDGLLSSSMHKYNGGVVDYMYLYSLPEHHEEQSTLW